MSKTCLNCKYEPQWSEPKGGEYPRSSGKCRWFEAHGRPKLPGCVQVIENGILRYADDSGVMTNCKTWEPKQ